ncbi:MAG: hypothetical protein V2I24_15240, partial [Halieaceae bacterium]|nr:hypothetical protein [Halieaceae bacterium]
TSSQEREAFRIQHHQMMQERARQQGVTLPEQPGAGPGMGPGRQGTPGKNQGQGKKKKRPGKGGG